MGRVQRGQDSEGSPGPAHLGLTPRQFGVLGESSGEWKWRLRCVRFCQRERKWYPTRATAAATCHGERSQDATMEASSVSQAHTATTGVHAQGLRAACRWKGFLGLVKRFLVHILKSNRSTMTHLLILSLGSNTSSRRK